MLNNETSNALILPIILTYYHFYKCYPKQKRTLKKLNYICFMEITNEMVEKIAAGKLNKFYKDSTLLNQEFVKDSSKTVAQFLDGVSKGLTVVSFKRVQLGA